MGETTKQVSLSELSKDYPFLLILDDVCSAAQVEPFHSLGSSCCILATSRSRRVLDDIDLAGHIIQIRPLSLAESAALFCKCAGFSQAQLDGMCHELIDRCGGIPLAIKIAGLMVKKRPKRVPTVVRYLKNNKLHQIKKYIPDYTLDDLDAQRGETILLNVIEACVSEFLSQTEYEAFWQLAAPPEKARIPCLALQTFWNTDAGDVEIIAEALADLALVEMDKDKTTVTLHDMVRSFLQHDKKKLVEIHKKLLRAYAAKCCPSVARRLKKGIMIPWHEVLPDGYFFENLPYHLNAAGYLDELHRLLLDYRWLRAKLKATDVHALLSDFAMDACVGDPDIRLVDRSIRLSAYVLASAPDQLSGQLYGRLLPFTSPTIQEIRNSIVKNTELPWLRPVSCGLETATGRLVTTINTGWFSTNDMIVLPDGLHIVSCFSECKVWDIQTQVQIAQFGGELDLICCLAVMPGGHALVTGSLDGILKLWNWREGEQLKCVDLRAREVRAVVVSRDARMAFGATRSSLEMVDLETWKRPKQLLDGRVSIGALALTDDGTKILAACEDSTVVIIYVQEGKVLQVMKQHREQVNAVAISPNGLQSVSASDDGTLAL